MMVFLIPLVVALQLFSLGGANKCPFANTAICMTWVTENRLTKLEGEMATTKTELSSAKGKLKTTESELASTKTELATAKRLLDNHLSNRVPWQLKRIHMALPKLTRMRLSAVTPTIDQNLPLPFPKNTKSIIVSILCSVSGANPRLHGSIQQKGGSDVTRFKKRCDSGYYQENQDEILLPWSSDGSNALQLKVSYSYMDGGANTNYFTFSIVGYIIAS